MAWLDQVYRGLVELADRSPVHEDAHVWVFPCRSLRQPGYPETPMLAASVVVPKDGRPPFHPASGRPAEDIADFGGSSTRRTLASQARKLNARGCVVSLDARMNGGVATPLPWSPAHEAPGWWQLMIRRYFPRAQQMEHPDWDSVIAAAKRSGEGTRGVVWVRREMGGYEASGHLLFVHNNQGNVVVLDALAGRLGRLEVEGIKSLTFAHYQPLDPAVQPSVADPDHRAADFRNALDKAREWLHLTYGDTVELVNPGLADEMARGWLFSCNTKEYLAGGDWRYGMVDAAIVVPKNTDAPFCLPHASPWEWLARWNRGDVPGTADLPLPQSPGDPAWLAGVLRSLGPVLAATEHEGWESALDALQGLPAGGRALVWVRRRDERGRETTGTALNAMRDEQGVRLLDGRDTGAPVAGLPDAWKLHVLQYR
ncbi:YrhB domain-containing protein [Streptomyces melanogenes]|uniref:YrhB domain-containing protein n=1 Tax=Streptomyces melanogenes TaxID=67326 RepID=UPI0037B39964